MTPPRTTDPADAGGPRATDADYDALVASIADTQGIINLAEARLVDLAMQGIAMGISGGTTLTPKAWLAWRAGISPERASSIIKIAERADKLPHTMEALRAGLLTIDQAAVIARHIPTRYEESAARVAQSCTVEQLRETLPHYRDRKTGKDKPKPEGDPDAHGSVSSRCDETGYHLHLHLTDTTQGAIVDQAIKAVHEDLRRQARADTPEGSDPHPVYLADAIVALAEIALLAGETARPGTDRYLVHVHLEHGPHGIVLMTHLGIEIPDGERRHLLCDSRLRALVHQGTTPLDTGRTTRTITRRMRRAIEHRDHGRCTVPGCGRTTNLEIHHIWHWEDGGPTDTHNLLTLCAHHHRSHHRGTLHIQGNADLPRHTAPGVVFTNHWGRPLEPVGHPTPPPPAAGADPAQHLTDTAAAAGLGPHRYTPPTGERLDRSGFHLIEADPEPPPPDDDETSPSPDITGQRPSTTPPDPTSPRSNAPTDPTRAGPTAA